MYHNIFFDFQNFEFRFLLWRHASVQCFPVFSSVSALLASVGLNKKKDSKKNMTTLHLSLRITIWISTRTLRPRIYHLILEGFDIYRVSGFAFRSPSRDLRKWKWGPMINAHDRHTCKHYISRWSGLSGWRKRTPRTLECLQVVVRVRKEKALIHVTYSLHN